MWQFRETVQPFLDSAPGVLRTDTPSLSLPANACVQRVVFIHADALAWSFANPKDCW